MKEEVKVTHNGVEITYDEGADVWRFEARGRERKAKSLAAARVTIDKPDPKEKKPFEPFEAIYVNYMARFERVTVTSLAESDGRVPSVWFVKQGSRSKCKLDEIIAISPNNLAAIERHRAASREIDVLRKELTEIINNMEHPVITVTE